MKNDFNYKWSKIFASKRFNKEDGFISLSPMEQHELLRDSELLNEKNKNYCCTKNLPSDEEITNEAIKRANYVANKGLSESVSNRRSFKLGADFVKNYKL